MHVQGCKRLWASRMWAWRSCYSLVSVQQQAAGLTRSGATGMRTPACKTGRTSPHCNQKRQNNHGTPGSTRVMQGFVGLLEQSSTVSQFVRKLQLQRGNFQVHDCYIYKQQAYCTTETGNLMKTCFYSLPASSRLQLPPRKTLLVHIACFALARLVQRALGPIFSAQADPALLRGILFLWHLDTAVLPVFKINT